MRDRSSVEGVRRAREAVELISGPAWVIDTGMARIVAQNDAGQRLLGLGSTPLDAAMPAITRLRRMAREVRTMAVAPQSLVFWTAQGAQSVECKIDHMNSDGRLEARASNDADLLLVTAAAGTVSKCAPQRPEMPVDEAPPAMDDAATLRQIAQRIKQGTAALAAGSGVLPVTTAAPSLSSTLVLEPAAEETGRPSHTAPPPRNDGSSRAKAMPGPGEPSTLAKLVHELKTPLSAIAAASEIMKDERLGAIGNDRYRDYAADIHDGARHAIAVIERLLGDAGRGTEIEGSALQFTSVEVNVLAESCFASMRPLAEAAELRMACDLDPEVGKLTADATSLRQILLNLLTNAVKFARPGDEVRLATRAAANGATAIEISDTGPGMSRAEIAAALDPAPPRPFTRRDGGGMGIGLPLVRSLVEANAGRLTIDGAPGRGTVVTITFPRKRLIAV
ncbi:MAG: sensor histidine kinase [Hyphomicrobium sp.]